MNQHTQKVETTITENSFGALGVRKEILEVLEKLRLTTPTPIQHKAIPVAIEGKDVVGIAQTGTGKTMAFGIPMIQRLASMPGKRGLVILPTRELALQVNESLRNIGRGFGLKTAVLIGGDSMRLQIQQIRNNPHIIIGTPGRLSDHLQQKTLNFNTMAIVVLDEADCMFDMGFAQQIKQMLALLPKEHQTLLFSATMPDAIIKVASTYMKLPLRIEIARPGTTAEKVEHELFVAKREQKMALLKKLLIEYKGSVLVFSRTKHGTRKMAKQLAGANFSVAEIHSNRSLSQRRQALEGFKSGKYRILVATDIASRGIDVKGIELVLNYDLPESAGDYVHRIGRTGRAGMTGRAISFVTPEQKSKVREIERLIRSTIPISQLPTLPDMPAAPAFVPNMQYQPKHQPRRPFQPFRHQKRSFSKRR